MTPQNSFKPFSSAILLSAHFTLYIGIENLTTHVAFFLTNCQLLNRKTMCYNSLRLLNIFGNEVFN